MKTKGNMAVRISYQKAWMPVLIGSALDIPDAASAARPTGGVTSAIKPK